MNRLALHAFRPLFGFHGEYHLSDVPGDLLATAIKKYNSTAFTAHSPGVMHWGSAVCIAS
jgi:hypothetical protein